MTNTTDPANAPEQPAEVGQVQRPVRPQDPKREALDREAWEALGFLSGLHPCMTVDWDRPLVVARTVFDAVRAEIQEWQRRATDQRLAVEQMNRLYREKTQECERLRAEIAKRDQWRADMSAALNSEGPNAALTGGLRPEQEQAT